MHIINTNNVAKKIKEFESHPAGEFRILYDYIILAHQTKRIASHLLIGQNILSQKSWNYLIQMILAESRLQTEMIL